MGVRNHVIFFQSQTLLPDSVTSYSVPSKRAEVLSMSLSFGNGNPRRQVTCSGPFTLGISVVSPVLFLSRICDQDWDLESCRGSSENVMLLKGLEHRHGGFTSVTRQKPIFSLQKISDFLVFSFQDENRKIFTSLKLEVKEKKKRQKAVKQRKHQNKTMSLIPRVTACPALGLFQLYTATCSFTKWAPALPPSQDSPEGCSCTHL